MSSKLFVGGLPWATREDGLREAFAPFGEITDSVVVLDRETGRSRGFGFVTYATADEAAAARDAMQGQEIDGRRVNVDIANDRGSRGGGGGGGGGRGGSRGPGGGGGGYDRGGRGGGGGDRW